MDDNGRPILIDDISKSVYPVDLAGQLAALKADPLLAQFRESRKRLSGDPYRPLYHFVAAEGDLNDPNGLCFWNGRWHLFYQAIPPGDPRPTIYWGHAVSDDLINWRDLPYAIYPNPEQECWSGATCVEPDRVIAMYYGLPVGIMTATSGDPLLLNWTKTRRTPVIPSELPDGTKPPYSVFDACIWQEGGWYYALSGGRRLHPLTGRGIRSEDLFRSRNLADWEYLHLFIDPDVFGEIGLDGACPYFWPIGDKYMLLHYSHNSTSRYLVGDYDRENQRFIPVNGGRFSSGSSTCGGLHAPSAFPDGEGNLIAIFNMIPCIGVQGGVQIMSLPQKLTLGTTSGDEISISPAGNTASLRYDHRSVASMTLPADEEIVLKDIKGDSLELVAEFEAKNIPLLELNVLRSPDSREFTRIGFYRERGTYFYDRDPALRFNATRDSVAMIDGSRSTRLGGIPLRPPEMSTVPLAKEEHLRLHVFVDKSIVEVFINDRAYVSQRVFPGSRETPGVSLCARGCDISLLKLDAWKLKSIYDGEGL
jgi:beta-fructofuranosidase